MCTTCILSTGGRVVEFDFVRGVGFATSQGRNLKEIVESEYVKLRELTQRQSALHQKLEELCAEEEILAQAIKEVSEGLTDLQEEIDRSIKSEP